MNAEQKKALEAAGWKFGDVGDFLNLSLIERIQVEVKVAMKTGNTLVKEILRVVLGDIGTLQNSKAQGGKPVTDEQVYKVIRNIIQGNTETLKFQANDKLVQENIVLESILPKQLSAEEIAAKLEGIKAEILAVGNPGKACGLAMKFFKQEGLAVDGNIVKEVVASMS